MQPIFEQQILSLLAVLDVYRSTKVLIKLEILFVAHQGFFLSSTHLRGTRKLVHTYGNFLNNVIFKVQYV